MDGYKPAPTKDCTECLSAIPEAARRWRECGAQLAPPSETVAAAMRQVAAPSGAEIADQAAKALSERLAGGSRQGRSLSRPCNLSGSGRAFTRGEQPATRAARSAC